MASQQQEQIFRYSEDDAAMAALARASHFGSSDEAARAYASVAPQVVAAMASAGSSPTAAPRLLISAQAMTWDQRTDPSSWFDNETPALGNEVSATIFQSNKSVAVAAAASEFGITDTSAETLFDIVSAVTLAVMAGSPDGPLTSESLAATLVFHLTPAANTSQTVPPEITSSKGAASAPTKAAPAASPSTTEEYGMNSNTELVLGAVAVLLIAVGLGVYFLTGSGGDDVETGEPDSIAFDDSDDPVVDAEADDEDVDSSFMANEEDESDSTDTSAEDTEPDSEQAVEGAETNDTDATDVESNVDDLQTVVSLSVPMTDITDTATDAAGTLNFDFDTVTGEVCYGIESINIEGPFRSHIHIGGADEQGGIVVDLGPHESGDVGCIANLPVDTNAILANPANHYAELHDVSEEFTIRGQLSEAEGAGGTDEQSTVDSTGGGASIVLEGGTIFLEGAVPDQATADEMLRSLADVDAATSVVDNLTVDADAPLPSGRVVITDAIFFDTASDEIRSIDEATLNAITALALSRPDWTLTVVGHTDSEGDDVDNLELSLRRATSLRDLLSALGVPDENLRIEGAGETDPIGDNTTAEGRAQNRRIEFEFTPNS